ncbi:hypothetical protein MGAS10750_Spy0336 [Streptococcus pyogenes MGAS10750]|nr:hypothetical protein MGAS10750_Spy0336 [Streptococcus pyogenes MGAS10750]
MAGATFWVLVNRNHLFSFRVTVLGVRRLFLVIISQKKGGFFKMLSFAFLFFLRVRW